jgi:hypothetical protein
MSIQLKIVVIITMILLTVMLAGYLAQRNARLDRHLIAVLDTIIKADQDFIAPKKGWKTDSREWMEWSKKCDEIDSANLTKVTEIINQYNWPGEYKISWQGASALWVVIQHSTLENQEKFLPLMRETVRKGKNRSGQLALLEDRVLKNQGKEQIYGSQFAVDSPGKKIFWQVEDGQYVNARRFSMGLRLIGLFARKMGVEYKSRKSEEPYSRTTFYSFKSLETNYQVYEKIFGN